MAKNLNKYQGTKTLEILKGSYNYNKWIASQILDYVKVPVLEFGAGTGNITHYICIKKPYTVSEVDSELLKKLNEGFSNDKDIEVINFDVTKEPPTGLINKFNSVFSSNVLEHIENDFKALKNINKTLKINGKLILLVPAKKRFYGKLDKELGHYRRYEKNELNQLVIDAGFEVEKIYFFNLLGLLAWKIRDLVTKENELNYSQVRIFDSIVPFLKVVESFVKPPIGISLIVVARKIS